MSAPMRVWILPGIYPYPDETGERWKGIFIHRQVQGLRRAGVDVQVVQPRDWYPPWPLWTLDAAWRTARAEWRPAHRELDTIPVSHPVVVSPRPSRLFRRPHRERVIARLARFLRARGVRAGRDVLLCHWLIPDGYIGTRVAMQLRLPIAVMMWGDDVAVWPGRSPVAHEQARWVIGHASTLLACSDDLGRKVPALSDAVRPLQTMYTSVDTGTFKPFSGDGQRAMTRTALGLAPDDIALLSVATLVRRKGWIELLDALRALVPQFPTLKLVAAHGGVPDLDLDLEAARRGVQDRVLNLGEVAPDALPPVYQSCDIFALPSHREGLANAVLEAMASGLPVVTTPVGGHPEVIRPGISGEFVPVANAGALETTLRTLLSQPHRWPEYGIQARADVERVASPEGNARRLRDILESIRQEHQPRADHALGEGEAIWVK